MHMLLGRKIGMTVGLTVVGLTMGVVLYYHAETRALVLDGTASRLRDAVSSAACLFDEPALRAIRKLKLALGAAVRPPGIEVFASADGVRAMPPATVTARLAGNEESGDLVRILRHILRDGPKAAPATGSQSRDSNESSFIKHARIVVAIPGTEEHAIVEWLAAVDADVPGAACPVGTRGLVSADVFGPAFAGRTSVAAGYSTGVRGPVLAAAFPLRDTDGAILAVVGLDADAAVVVDRLNALDRTGFAIMFLVVLVAFIVALVLAKKTVRPLRLLQAAAERVRKLDFGTRVDVGARDESGRLAGTFNAMVREIRGRVGVLERARDGCARFVAPEVTALLEQDGPEGLSPGDFVEREMSIVFSAIRPFASLCAGMTAEENFAFLNAYLERIEPVIRESNGFIERCTGETLLGLFPRTARDAVFAAVEMRREIKRFNDRRAASGLEKIGGGIGVHSGGVMLGMLGAGTRIAGVAISPDVSLAERLEGLTARFGAPLVISAATLEHLGPAAAEYRIRSLGRVQGVSTNETLVIHEIIDAESDEQAEAKLAIFAVFSDAVRLYGAGQFAAAAALFAEAARQAPEDRATALYLRLAAAKSGVAIE